MAELVCKDPTVFLGGGADPGNNGAYSGSAGVLMEEYSQTAKLQLWRRAPGDSGRRKLLAAVTRDLTAGQWGKLKVRTFQNRIQCYDPLDA